MCVQVHFIVAACENMISGTGMRPGDILTASNGKTIEVPSPSPEVMNCCSSLSSSLLDHVVFLYTSPLSTYHYFINLLNLS